MHCHSGKDSYRRQLLLHWVWTILVHVHGLNCLERSLLPDKNHPPLKEWNNICLLWLMQPCFAQIFWIRITLLRNRYIQLQLCFEKNISWETVYWRALVFDVPLIISFTSQTEIFRECYDAGNINYWVRLPFALPPSHLSVRTDRGDNTWVNAKWILLRRDYISAL